MAKKSSKTKNGLVVAVVIFMIFMMILFAAGGIFSSLSRPSPAVQDAGQSTNQPTKVISYIPDTPTIGMTAKSGSCWVNSVAAPYRADAWRCAVGNEISDPCFEVPNQNGAKELICGRDQENSNATSTFMLKLIKPLPVPGAVPDPVPSNWAWAVMLADGTYCTPFTGTRPFAATGEAAIYACASKNPAEEYIFGDLNNDRPVWTAAVGTLSKSTSTYPPAIESLQNISVRTVWQ